jgi:hypothetical protein
MSVKTATLDANSETFEIDLNGSSVCLVTMTITGTITVAWTMKARGGSNAVNVTDSNGDAQSFTASGYIRVLGPGTLIGTASGVSSGSCAIEADVATV